MKTSRQLRQLRFDLDRARSEFKRNLAALVVEMSQSDFIEFHASFLYVVQTITSETYANDPELAVRELDEIAMNAKTIQKQYLRKAARLFQAYVEKTDRIASEAR